MKPVISVKNISKQYRLGTIGTGTIRDDFKRWWHQSRGKEDPFLKIGESNDRSTAGKSDYVWALKDISFNVMPGDILGIVGKNGAGKSTLLKILSKVTGPTTGRIDFNGRIGSLLEVGTGFHPDLTGRENIFLNGAILGMTTHEIRARLDEIIDFSGCERYIDTPTKRYSSGMIVRLGFAVAAHLNPEILIVDEVLAVGDAEFQKKAIGKMRDVNRNDGRTVLFVSHNMGSISTLCSTGILMSDGIVQSMGKIDDVINEYLHGQNEVSDYKVEKVNHSSLYVNRIELKDAYLNKKNNFLHTEKIRIEVSLVINEMLPNTFLFITVLDKQKVKVFSAEKEIRNQKDFLLEIKCPFLTRGFYSLQVIVYRPAIEQYDFIEDTCGFSVIDAGSEFSHLETFNYGCVFGDYEWLEEKY